MKDFMAKRQVANNYVQKINTKQKEKLQREESPKWTAEKRWWWWT